MLQCINKSDNLPFDEYDEAMVKEFADEVGIILGRRQLEAAYHSVLEVDEDTADEQMKKNKAMLGMYTQKKMVLSQPRRHAIKNARSKRLSMMERKSILIAGIKYVQSNAIKCTV